MTLLKINREITHFENFLDANALRNTEIENYIIRYLLIFCCAEFSELIREKISNRVRAVNDTYIVHFVEKNIDMRLRNPKMENIYKVLEQFNEGLKDELKKNVDERIRTNWDSIIVNRNLVAHYTQCNISITITELKSLLTDISSVIDEIGILLR
jgi:hypothetical protein